MDHQKTAFPLSSDSQEVPRGHILAHLPLDRISYTSLANVSYLVLAVLRTSFKTFYFPYCLVRKTNHSLYLSPLPTSQPRLKHNTKLQSNTSKQQVNHIVKHRYFRVLPIPRYQKSISEMYIILALSKISESLSDQSF